MVVLAPAPRTAVVSTRLPPDKKAEFAALAARHQLSESALLSQLVDEVVRSNAARGSAAHRAAEVADVVLEPEIEAERGGDERITLRLRRGDRMRAVERASARGVKLGTYLALLVHNHVRASDVMPPQELDHIKAVGARLAALARELRAFSVPNNRADLETSELRDQIARLHHEVEVAREASAAVVRRNLLSWETGHA